jgi:uncharacterized protein
MADLSAQNSLGFLHHLLLFCRKLQQEGVKVALPQEIDACRSLEYIDIFAYNDFYYALKANLISRPEDITVFDKIFFSHWSSLKGNQLEEQALIKREKTSKDSIEEENSLRREKEKLCEIIFSERSQDRLRKKNESQEIPVYSPHEKLAKQDFSAFSDEELERIKKAISLIAQKISLRETRRKKADNKACLFDFRRTIRKNVRHGGDIINFAWKKPKVTETRIVLLCDVSGSMEVYSRFLVQFFYGLQNSLRGVETFVFSTRLSRITRILRKEGFEKALEKISREVPHWGGGTNIGECLREFNHQNAPNFLYRRTIVIIVSDGWDRGESSLLQEEMKKLRRKAYQIIWLNPLLGNPHYQHTSKGMKTALPFLDQFLPLHNLDSLIHLGEVLYRIQ